MITDKDREEIISLLSGNYSCERTWSAWQYGTMHEDDFAPLDEDDSFIDDLLSVVDRIRTESADQARKEAADRFCASCHGKEDDMCGECPDRAVILNSPVKEGKTDAEKLTIAVKALEDILVSGTHKTIAGRTLDGESVKSDVVMNQYAVRAETALKEIQ